MVKVLGKAFLVLNVMADPNAVDRSWSLSSLSQTTGIPLSSLHRILSTFVRYRFVQRDPSTGHYRLGLRFLEMGFLVWERIELGRVARPWMDRLAQRTEDTVYLTLRDESDGVYIDKVDSRLYLRIAEPIGLRRPLWQGASRRAILAFLPEHEQQPIVSQAASAGIDEKWLRTELSKVRQQGYAVSVGETTVGTTGVAAPLIDYRGCAIAAISNAGPNERFPDSRLPEVIAAVTEAASGINSLLRPGGTGNPSLPRRLMSPGQLSRP